MSVIQIYSSPHDQHELRERVTAFGSPGLVRCQVAGHDMNCSAGTWKYPEVLVATKVGRRIDLLPAAKEWRVGAGKKIGISARCEGGLRDGVATVAVAGHVDQIASQSDHIRVFASHVQLKPYRAGYLEPRSDHFFFILRAVVVVECLYRARTDHGSRNDQSGE